MMQYVNESKSTKKSKEDMKKDLNSIGIELVSYKEQSIPNNSMPSDISMLTTTYPSDATMSIYTAKRIGDSY